VDQPEKQRPDTDGSFTLTPDMRPVSAEDATAQHSRAPADTTYPRRSNGLAVVLGTLGMVCGLAGLGAATWIYTEGQAEMRRLASDIAQLRVSLELYARGASANPGTDQSGLLDLSNRLAILEQNWRSSTVPLPTSAAPAATASTNEDCLPSGMRILVAEGDSYPVCGQSGSVNVGQVANGYIVLLDGTTIASGGSIPLPETQCTIGVTSDGDEGLTGYAEIRVTC